MNIMMQAIYHIFLARTPKEFDVLTEVISIKMRATFKKITVEEQIIKELNLEPFVL